MARRAKYVGPDPETRVYAPDDTYLQHPIVVQQGAYLPSDQPQRLHAEIGERNGWKLEDAPSSSKKDDTEDGEN